MVYYFLYKTNILYYNFIVEKYKNKNFMFNGS